MEVRVTFWQSSLVFKHYLFKSPLKWLDGILGYYFYRFEPDIHYSSNDEINLNPKTLIPRSSSTELVHAHRRHYMMLFSEGEWGGAYLRLLSATVFHTKGSCDHWGNVIVDSTKVGESKMLQSIYFVCSLIAKFLIVTVYKLSISMRNCLQMQVDKALIM